MKHTKLQLLVSSTVAVFALVGFARSARADEPAKPTVEPDKTTDQKTESDIKHLSLEINPLAATIGRYSIQAEWMPAKHSAFVLNPHFDHVSPTVTVNGDSVSETFTGFGGELGYRFYTGSKGPNGFFVGPSVLAGTYTSSVASGPSVSFTSIGAAVDVGGQAMIGPGILIGAGFGLQYTSVSQDFKDLPLTAGVIAGGGLRPRFLLSAGYAFL